MQKWSTESTSALYLSVAAGGGNIGLSGGGGRRLPPPFSRWRASPASRRLVVPALHRSFRSTPAEAEATQDGLLKGATAANADAAALRGQRGISGEPISPFPFALDLPFHFRAASSLDTRDSETYVYED